MPFDSGGSRILSGNQHKQIETMQTYSLPAVNPQTLCGGPVLTTHICDQNDQKKRAFLRLQPAIIISVSVIGYWNISYKYPKSNQIVWFEWWMVQNRKTSHLLSHKTKKVKLLEVQGHCNLNSSNNRNNFFLSINCLNNRLINNLLSEVFILFTQVKSDFLIIISVFCKSASEYNLSKSMKQLTDDF